MLPIPIVILLCVLVAIALRQLLHVPFKIWQITLVGAIATLLCKGISPVDAWHAINFSVLGFLLGAFIIGQGLEQSGYAQHVIHFMFYKKERADLALLTILFVSGFCSIFLMNDTVAIIATPLLLLLTRQQLYLTQPFLLALAFGITIGSVTSPIGNPQNLLIASYLPNPFILFTQHLFLASVLNLLIAYLFLKIYYRRPLRCTLVLTINDIPKDPALSRLTLISVILLVVLVLLKILLNVLHIFDIPLYALSLIAMLPLLIVSRQRVQLLKKVDGGTLIFFIALFILMASVWQTGYLQALMHGYSNSTHSSVISIFGVSIVYSQIISNVPLVALYLPILLHSGAPVNAVLALAAGSTLAGNFFILGAVSNIIIMQLTENRHRVGFSMTEFSLIGVPLTIVNSAVIYLFL